MKIIKHVDYPDIRKRPVSREIAYTTVLHNDITYIRTLIDDHGHFGKEWTKEISEISGEKRKRRYFYIDDSEEDILEELYQKELMRIERENKLNRIGYHLD